MIALIAACDMQNAIAKDGRIPWNIPSDLKWFKTKTLGHTVVMGRKTFQSIGSALSDRTNIVLSRNPAFKAPDCICMHSPEDVLSIHKEQEEMFIIGGEEIYKIFLPFAEKIYLTRIEQNFSGDKYFPQLSDTDWLETGRREGIRNDENPYDYCHIELSRYK